ncbi:MAG TPA: Trk system potassium transporter TrkA [Acidobacteria bacterium]|nr:Trk system potassium transporter TrkA [Acidobacteriota bacterium]
MDAQRFVVMGAGEVGFHLARVLAQEGHQVTVIEPEERRGRRIEEELDVLLVRGNGAHLPVLREAQVEGCDLFIAVSSNDEANLVASRLARRLGAVRTAVRVGSAEEVIEHRWDYENLFEVDLLLSTELLTTTSILNAIRGQEAVAVESFAGGKVEVRQVRLEAGSPLVRAPLREAALPDGSLVAALFRGGEVIIPAGEDQARPGDEALILAGRDVIDRVERRVTDRRASLGLVVLAGGGATAHAVARFLSRLETEVKIIESERRRAEELAARFPEFQVIHGDATDQALLKAERIGAASSFVALTGSDEVNLMACLLAQELGSRREIALVQRAESSRLWGRLGLEGVLAPRALANRRIHDYIESGYSANIVSLQRGAAQVLERRLFAASPAAGVSLAEIRPPRGLIVATVVRDGRVFVPRGDDRLAVGDAVILFVRREELSMAQVLFPEREPR